MNGTFRLFSGLLAKELIILKSYWLNTAASIVGAFAIFLIAFLGGQAVAGPQLEDSLGGIVVGYFLVILAIAAYQDTTNKVTQEAQWGTLEQLHMTPLGFGRVILLQGIVTILYSFIFGIGVLIPMLAVTGVDLSLDVVTIIPIAALAVASIVGIGLMLAGFAVVHKKIDQVLNLLQWGIFGLVAAPLSGHILVYILPVTQGSAMLQRAMQDGVRLWEFPVTDLAVLLVVGVGYLVIGYLVFMRLTDRARRLGVLGHY